MVLLRNERPNFPTNWLKHINKGLISIIVQIFQTEHLGRRRGAYNKIQLPKGGLIRELGLKERGTFNRAFTLYEESNNISLQVFFF